MDILQTQPDATEIKVQRAISLCFAAGSGQEQYGQCVTSFNDTMEGR